MLLAYPHRQRCCAPDYPFESRGTGDDTGYLKGCRIRTYAWRLLFCLVLALTGASWGWGQQTKLQYTYRAWTVEEGLPQVSVNAIAQTPDGYLWLGTNGGLVRFDGVRFKVYNTANTPAIKSNRINALEVDKKGRLWIGAEGYVMWRIDGLFQALKTPGAQEITLFFEDHDGSMWVAVEDILRHFDTELGYRDVHTFEDPNTILSIYRDGMGHLWVGTHFHLYQLVEGELVPDRPLGGVMVEEKVHAITSTSLQVYWVGTPQKLLHIEKGHVGAVLEEDTYNTPIQDILLVDRKGNLWAQTNQGLYLIEKTGDAFADPRLIEPIPDIGSIFEDREGNLWVGSYTGGLFRFTTQRIGTLSAHEEEGPNMQAIMEARDGSMWLGEGCAGVSRRQEGRVATYRKADGLTSECVWSLAEDSDGNVWVGTWGGGLYQWTEGRIKKVETAFVNPDAVILVIYEDRRGALWLGMLKHLVRVDPDGSHRVFTTADGLPHGDIRHIYEARNGDLWFGTRGGMARLSGDTWTAYTTEDGLSHDYVRAFYEDDEGTIWVGTYGGGLNRFKDGRFTRFTMADGLGDDTISRIFEDEHGRLWVSGNLGISSIPKAQLHAFAAGEIARLNPAVYNEADGMPHRETNGGFQPAGWQRRNGEMWFPTQAGVAIVDVDQLTINEIPPPVHIEEVRVDGVVRDPTSPLVLDVSTRNIEIDYTGSSFVDPEHVQFRYRLLGVEDQWHDVGGRRTAYFTNLKSGRYTFQVSASNNDGVWNTEGARLSLLIPTPWWRTRWAYVSYVLVVLLGLWGYVQGRTRTLERRREETEALLAARTQELREKTEQLQALDETKSRFFANISHEFRTPLTLAIGPLEDARAGRHGVFSSGLKDAIDQALLNNRRLLRLVNQLLDVARLEALELQLHVRPVDLNVFLDNIARAFVPLAERKHITWTRTLPEEPLHLSADPDRLEKVVTNLLSNAFKFTPEHGRIALTLHSTGEAVVIKVRDTGPGIPAEHLPKIFDRFHQVDTGTAQAGTGIGLALAKELVALHGGDIAVESEEGFGTTFTVTLPTGAAHLEEAGHVVDLQPTTPPFPPLAEMATAVVSKGDEAPKHDEEEDEDRLTILVVDDNAEIRAYVKGHLREMYRVVEAVDGAEGLALARAITPDLILSDVMMPELDGYGFCRAVKTDPELDFIPVILLTAKASPESKIEGLAEGADDYLIKPFSTDELKARIRNLIAQRQRLRERFQAARPAFSQPPLDVQASDTLFLNRLQEIVEAHLADEAFTVEAMAEAAGVGRSQLYRRMQELVGCSPSAYLWQLRLEKAAHLLVGQAGTVSEVAYAVGFKSVPHFTRRFRAHFGCSPTAYVAAHRPADASS